MFRSIRWRLVTSYVLITLLTAGLVGVLGLSLLRRYADEQALAHLRANAEGLALQARPLIEPIPDRAALERLARAAAFLGDVRVRILDAQEAVLANSGHPADTNAYIWISSAGDGATLPWMETFGLETVPRAGLSPALGSRVDDLLPPQLGQWLPGGQWPVSIEVIVARRTTRQWGGLFVFDTPYRVEMPANAPLASGVTVELDAHGAPAARSRRTVVVPIGEDTRPSGYVEFSEGVDVSGEALTTARRALLLASGAAVSLAAVAGLGISQRLAAPIRGLTDVANRMATGDLAARAPAGGQDETGQLSRQFNQMADQLQATFADLATERDTLRRFMADASHELRTPITALRSYNELLQTGAAEDPATRTEFLVESAGQIERLTWITSHLLDLARLDAGLTALALAPAAAAALIEEAAAPFRVRAAAADIALRLALPDPALALVCDRARVVLALSNLLDNALKFTPPGGTVTVGAERSDAGVRFWVHDTGPGIPAEEQARVFERFYRGQHAVGQTPGAGLGLAIVRAVAQAHNGTASVVSAPGHGSRFTLELPDERPPGSPALC